MNVNNKQNQPSPETAAGSPPAVQQGEENKKPNAGSTLYSRHRLLFGFTVVLLFLGFCWLLYWIFYLQYHEYTDDAYANGNMIHINAAVSGSVTAFYADDTDLVVEGQLLVTLDRTEYQAIYEKELAALGVVALQVRQLHDTVRVNRAIVDSRRSTYSKAKYDYNNRSQLISSLAISDEDFTHAKDDLAVAESNLKQAEEQLLASEHALGKAPLDKHPLIEQQKGQVADAYYKLKHCAIYAPATGYVAQRKVNVGHWVLPSTNMMAVIPVDYVWVDANFKETQLTYMKIGQPAKVWFDLYGSSVEYHGKVIGIASGSGSVFSLIPPQNATGNWIKIVQRLAVRISLDPETVRKYPVRLGISAEVDVNITDQDLPVLSPVPPQQPVDTTKVFDLDFASLNKLMEEIIQKNLQDKL